MNTTTDLRCIDAVLFVVIVQLHRHCEQHYETTITTKCRYTVAIEDDLSEHYSATTAMCKGENRETQRKRKGKKRESAARCS
ncbi:Hypothetical predicted protein [Olea europaea subsp. europaea]|uniref:Uncharacterized protein n=1 Tax=Olea europaea subsp. europaea TaxID=158383 RepID=A0A8S0U0P3_OLEEU|nr:Hypothetical predicted protein [Olea europaea subsp. europaea]